MKHFQNGWHCLYMVQRVKMALKINSRLQNQFQAVFGTHWTLYKLDVSINMQRYHLCKQLTSFSVSHWVWTGRTLKLIITLSWNSSIFLWINIKCLLFLGWFCTMLRDDGSRQQQDVCCESNSSKQSVKATPERKGNGEWLFAHAKSRISSFLFNASILRFCCRSLMKSSFTKASNTSMWWSFPIILRTKTIFTSSLNSAAERWVDIPRTDFTFGQNKAPILILRFIFSVSGTHLESETYIDRSRSTLLPQTDHICAQIPPQQRHPP